MLPHNAVLISLLFRWLIGSSTRYLLLSRYLLTSCFHGTPQRNNAEAQFYCTQHHLCHWFRIRVCQGAGPGRLWMCSSHLPPQNRPYVCYKEDHAHKHQGISFTAVTVISPHYHDSAYSHQEVLTRDQASATVKIPLNAYKVIRLLHHFRCHKNVCIFLSSSAILTAPRLHVCMIWILSSNPTEISMRFTSM